MVRAIPNIGSATPSGVPFNVAAIQHPFYGSQVDYWRLFRYTMEGGWRYINRYLTRNPAEGRGDFILRRRRSYNPAFAKQAVMEVRNAIYQRMSDIIRDGGTYSYARCMVGDNNGVDLLGASMNTFMGVNVLPELLFMGKVGIYVDAPPRQGDTLIENLNARPYLYTYRTEDIRSWAEDDTDAPNQYRSLLLREMFYIYDQTTGLPMNESERFRHYYKDDSGKVWVQFYNAESNPINMDGSPSDGPILLNIPKIPFVVIDLGESLLKETAYYQKALLNLASADMHYCTSANFPFYVEQFDPRVQSPHLRRNMNPSTNTPASDYNFSFPNDVNTAGSAEYIDSEAGIEERINVGPTTGRKYPLGTNQPAFINPSSEPITASMAKQEQLKIEIRMLVHLTLTTLSAKMASAESKQQDRTPLESGLSYIGLKLEDAERQIAQLWSLYEGQPNNLPTISYPSKYSLKTDADRFVEVDKLIDYIDTIPSLTYKKAIAKQIVEILLSSKISNDALQMIYQEIDQASIVTGNPDKVNEDVKVGILDPELAAEIRGYPKGTVAKAQVFHANRLALIQKAQSSQGSMPAPGQEINTNPDNQTDIEQSKVDNPAARGIADQSAIPSLATQVEKTPMYDVSVDGSTAGDVRN